MALTKMTVAQIRELTDAELDAKLAEYRKEGFSLRFKAATEVLGEPDGHPDRSPHGGPSDDGAGRARGEEEGAMSEAQHTRGQRKPRTGTVTSDKMHKSVVVELTRRVTHGLYGKQSTRTRRVVAHDEKNEAKVGDLVRIVETRPLSKTKRWRVLEVVERAK